MKFTLSTTILSLVAAASLSSAAPARLDNQADITLEKRGYNGKATWYTQNGQPGACGAYSSDGDHVVALASSNYAGGSACGKSIKITNTDTGASTTAKIMDQCPSCEGSGYIDLSTAAFDSLGSRDQGILPVTWEYV